MSMNSHDYLDTIEKHCSRCGKLFIVAPQHIYKQGRKVYCSWTCYNHRNDEHCVVCGEIIPEGRQVCPNCESEVQIKKKIKRRRMR